MNLLLIFLNLSLFSIGIEAAPATEKLMQEICLYARGCERFATKAELSLDMLKEYAKFVEDYEFHSQRILSLNKVSDDLPGPGGLVWGELEKGQAYKFILSHDSQIEGSLDESSLNKIVSLLSRNNSLKYGFSPHTGGSLCGVGFPGLIILDENNQSIYDLSLFGWPSC
jgi:hypothetical protein